MNTNEFKESKMPAVSGHLSYALFNTNIQKGGNLCYQHK